MCASVGRQQFATAHDRPASSNGYRVKRVPLIVVGICHSQTVSLFRIQMIYRLCDFSRQAEAALTSARAASRCRARESRCRSHRTQSRWRGRPTAQNPSSEYEADRSELQEGERIVRLRFSLSCCENRGFFTRNGASTAILHIFGA